MTALELGQSPRDGFNSTATSTDLSSSDQTRTLGAFNTAQSATAVLGHSDQGVGVVAEGGSGRPALIATSEGGSAALFLGRVGVNGDLSVTKAVQSRELESRLDSLATRVAKVAAHFGFRDIERAMMEDNNAYMANAHQAPGDPFSNAGGIASLLGHDV